MSIDYISLKYFCRISSLLSCSYIYLFFLYLVNSINSGHLDIQEIQYFSILPTLFFIDLLFCNNFLLEFFLKKK